MRLINVSKKMHKKFEKRKYIYDYDKLKLSFKNWTKNFHCRKIQNFFIYYLKQDEINVVLCKKKFDK